MGWNWSESLFEEIVRKPIFGCRELPAWIEKPLAWLYRCITIFDEHILIFEYLDMLILSSFISSYLDILICHGNTWKIKLAWRLLAPIFILSKKICWHILSVLYSLSRDVRTGWSILAVRVISQMLFETKKTFRSGKMPLRILKHEQTNTRTEDQTCIHEGCEKGRSA